MRAAAGSPAPTTRLASTCTLHRVGGDPVVAVSAQTLLQGRAPAGRRYASSARTCRRASRPPTRFRPGVTVDRVVSAAPDQLVGGGVGGDRRDAWTARSCSCQRRPGERDARGGYDNIDCIKVLPQAGMARVGGVEFPETVPAVRGDRVRQRPGRQAGHQGRSRARAGRRGLEHRGVHGDVRRRRQGFRRHDRRRRASSRRIVDGPNPKRKHSANNYGDVWVVATFDAPPARRQPRSRDGAEGARASARHRAAVHASWIKAEVGR